MEIETLERIKIIEDSFDGLKYEFGENSSFYKENKDKLTRSQLMAIEDIGRAIHAFEGLKEDLRETNSKLMDKIEELEVKIEELKYELDS